MKLNNRQQQVLGATVRHYIATAKPVGSEALVEGFNPRVSPATIRNAMGYLEKAGLLYQPHTSAGRVPSDSGYRIYVDQFVIPSDQVARQVDQMLASQLDIEKSSLEAVLRGAAQVLSNLSGYIALITLPLPSLACLRHLQLVQIDPGQVMLIVVLDSYQTESMVLDFSQSTDATGLDLEALERELQILSNFLNAHLRGRSLGEIAALDWSELGRQFDRYVELLQSSMLELSRRTRASFSTQILISGVAEVLRRQPEFAEIQQIQTILQLLESEQDQLGALIFTSTELDDKRVMVRIGSENPLEPMRACALVAAAYYRDEVPVGSVGMLGPTRMVYEDAIAIVETTADYLSETLSQSL